MQDETVGIVRQEFRCERCGGLGWFIKELGAKVRYTGILEGGEAQ